MCDDDIHVGLIYDPTVSRRTFGLMAAGAATLGPTGAYAADVVEKDVNVTTADGVADAALFYPPGKGKWPAVLIWTDIAGLRPAFRDMGRRLAAQGYVVLVPNPFYRSVHGVVATPGFDFNKPEDRARVMGYRGAMTNDGVDKDATAYVAFLDAQPQTNHKKKVGVQGYCMGGPLSFRTAAAVPGRIAAVGSFHGGGLTTKAPDSPHLLIARTKASFACCVAQNDDKTQPESKDILKATFAEAKRPASVEVYPANHGWCVKGSAVYDEASAEKAWGVLTELYKTNLA
ncbi:dienelactone hydrolase family protein [Phenylobacterium sp.]|uniref:dienelactone hydrolase family protein n=1 Tax=Phenylobacterium sp. TaxID=1871053 RepID=UPI0025DBAEF2|nr:dienelactone hydrolase family protein [Phenylobacterium sp.]